MLHRWPAGARRSRRSVRHLARLVDARYSSTLPHALLGPNEIFGPVDIREAFPEGRFLRVDAMLPDAEIVFLDEIFKSNSRCLERAPSASSTSGRFFTGQRDEQGSAVLALRRHQRGVPNDDRSGAVFDTGSRAALSDTSHLPLPRPRRAGLRAEVDALAAAPGAGADAVPCPSLLSPMLPPPGAVAPVHALLRGLPARYRVLVFQIRSEGVT